MDTHSYRGGKKKLLFLIPVIILLVGGIVMLLWNAILPELLQVKHITYWQSVGLLILCRILFGGFHAGPKGGPGHLREKWRGMSEEERAQFKEQWKRRWQ